MHEMGCAELVETVTEYLEKALGAEDRQRFEQHLAGCDDCVEYVTQYRTTIVQLGRVDGGTLPDGLRQGLLESFRGRRRA
jgi:anti-sigma factor RsiW